MKRNSFILHLDSLKVLDKLSDEQAGKLFKAIYHYHIEKDYTLDFALEMAFLPFENQFERDEVKYEKVVNRNRNNGSKGGRPKKPKETEKTQSVYKEPKKADSDSVSVSVSVSDSVNVNDNKIKDINTRKAEFRNSLQPFLEKYGRDLLNEFFYYWTEHNEKGKKMRYEMAKNQPFNLSRRLITWNNRNNKSNNNQGLTAGQKAGWDN